MRRPRPDAFTITSRQARFAAEYVKDLDSYAAALRAGYGDEHKNTDAVRLIGRMLLKKPQVLEHIKMEQDRISFRNDGLQDKIVDELSKIAFFNLKRLYTPDGKLKAIKDMDEDTTAALERMKITNIEDGVSLVEVTAQKKIAALEMLAKVTGLIRPDVKVTLRPGQTDAPAAGTHKVIFEDASALPAPGFDEAEIVE